MSWFVVILTVLVIVPTTRLARFVVGRVVVTFFDVIAIEAVANPLG